MQKLKRLCPTSPVQTGEKITSSRSFIPVLVVRRLPTFVSDTYGAMMRRADITYSSREVKPITLSGKSQSTKIGGPVQTHSPTLRRGSGVWGLPDYTTITNGWVAILDSLEIPTYDEFGLKRRIHSLRHTFISIAIANVSNAALVQFVVGHSRTQSLGITSRYTHRPPLRELLCVVDSMG